MSEAVVDDIVAVLPPLLQSLEALGFIARHLNPPHSIRSWKPPASRIRPCRPSGRGWPTGPNNLRHPDLAATASDAALAAFAGLRAVQHGNGDLIAVFRALRYAPRAQEALYPLAAKLPPVSSFFVDPALREDAGLPAPRGAGNENTGSFTTTTSPAAAAASRSMCRNITRPTAPGRW